MSSPTVYPSALALEGFDATTRDGNYFSGTTWWVSSLTGIDSVSFGRNLEFPLKSWAYAYDQASAGDIILCASGHIETLAADKNLAKAGVCTVALGAGPAAPVFSGVHVLNVQAADLKFHGISFNSARLTATAAGMDIWGCTFACALGTSAVLLSAGADRASIRSSTFVANVTKGSTAIGITSAVNSPRIIDVSVDGGVAGWASNAINVTAAATEMYFSDVRLSRYSDIVVNAVGATYKMFGVRAVDSSGCRITLST